MILMQYWQYLVRFKSTHGMDKFYMLFEQHNEHRLFFSRIIYILYKHLFGEINFIGLIYIGNSLLIIAFMMCVSFIKKWLPDHWFIASFVLSLCFFDLTDWGAITTAMGSMQNFGIFFLFISSVKSIKKCLIRIPI